MADRSSSERRERSFSEKITAVPARVSTKMNSRGNVASTAQRSTSATKTKKAVRESKNTVMITGRMASGTQYMPLRSSRATRAVKMKNTTMSSTGIITSFTLRSDSG